MLVSVPFICCLFSYSLSISFEKMIQDSCPKISQVLLLNFNYLKKHALLYKTLILNYINLIKVRGGKGRSTYVTTSQTHTIATSAHQENCFLSIFV